MRDLKNLLESTQHHWTAPIPIEQMAALAGLRGMYDELAVLKNELSDLASEVTQWETALKEAGDADTKTDAMTGLDEAAIALSLREAEEAAVIEAIEAEEDRLTTAGQHEILQLQITLQGANGRTEAAYRALFSEAAVVFDEETGYKMGESENWPAEKRQQYNAIVTAFSSWARAIAHLQKIEERVINALKFNPEDYGDKAGPWEEVMIAEEWRDPIVALDILPRTLLDRMASQALLTTRGTFDPRFFPAAARNKTIGSAAT